MWALLSGLFKTLLDSVFGAALSIFKTDKAAKHQVVTAKQELSITDGKTDEERCEDLGL